ncbi:MAG: hypothetical protein ACO4AI_01625 [Prochlorothrix sp.]|nr:hypothetical protein [Prochlorothrix sp.]
MRVEHFYTTPATTADQDQIEKVRRTIEQALADGVLSREENDQILSTIYSDGKVTQAECELFRVLQEKIWRGEVSLDD